MPQKPLSLQVVENERRKSGLAKLAANPGYARMPFKVLIDRKLEHFDVRLYGILSWSERMGIANIGERLMAELMRAPRPEIRSSLKRLMERKHIALYRGMGRGQRHAYRLTDKIFRESRPEVIAEVPHLSLACNGCQQPLHGALLCPECQRRQELADAI